MVNEQFFKIRFDREESVGDFVFGLVQRLQLGWCVIVVQLHAGLPAIGRLHLNIAIITNRLVFTTDVHKMAFPHLATRQSGYLVMNCLTKLLLSL